MRGFVFKNYCGEVGESSPATNHSLTTGYALPSTQELMCQNRDFLSIYGNRRVPTNNKNMHYLFIAHKTLIVYITNSSVAVDSIPAPRRLPAALDEAHGPPRCSGRR